MESTENLIAPGFRTEWSVTLTALGGAGRDHRDARLPAGPAHRARATGGVMVREA